MKKLFSLFVLLLITLSINAVPAKRGLVRTLTLQNGQTVQATLVGDEFGHFYRGTDGKAYNQVPGQLYYQEVDAENIASIARARRAKANVQRSKRLAPQKVGSFGDYTGAKKCLIILAQTSDVSFKSANNKAYYERIANEIGFSDGNFVGSMYDYFYAQSDGIFQLTFDVVGPVTVSKTMATYGGNDSNGDDKDPGALVKEAVNLANSSVNYADYDWDNDGYVDQVYVIYAGKGEADGGADDTIWPHAWDLSSATGSYVTADGVKINNYACGGELDGQTGSIAGIGTMCHEFSHCLGFPDFYDTDYSGGWGMDEWDLMCSGSYNGDGYIPCGYTSYERWAAGWKTPIELSATTSVSNMAGLTDGGNSYIVYNTGNSNEYFMLENRSNSSWDAPLNGHGLLIVHVDYNATSWNNNTPNDDPSHQRMIWIPADNQFQYTTYNSTKYLTAAGLTTDTYPTSSNNTFGPNSTPKATWYNNNAEGNKWMEQTIANITKSSTGLISFNFQGLSNVATPTFSPAAGKYADAQNVTISCETSGATIYYTTDGNDPTTSSSVYTTPINVAVTTTIKAMAVYDNEQSAIATAVYKIGAVTGDDFELVTNTTGLVSGDDYIIGLGSESVAAGALGSQILASESVTVDGNIITKTDDVLVFTVTQESDGWTFYNEDNGYLYATAAKKLAWDSTKKYWTLANGTAGVIMTYGSYGTMLYNKTSPRFTTYTSSPSASMIQANLYKAVSSSTPVVTIPAPILSPAGGEVASGTVVTITNDNQDYMYFYTTDGTDPDCDSNLDPTGTSQTYDGNTGIVINSAMTVKVIASDIDGNKSQITSATYTLPVAVTGVTLNKATTSIVVGSTETLTATVAPSGASQSVTWSSNATGVATVNSSGVVTGVSAGTATITATSTADNTKSASCTVTVVGKVATPTFSPAAGTIFETTNVTISCATSDATIHYTTDGTTPTASSATYSAAIPVSETTTIKAIAVKSGMVDSEVAEATYTFLQTYKFQKVNAVTPGKRYLLVYNISNNLKLMTTPSTASNGYPVLTDPVTENNGFIELTDQTNIFTFEAATGGFYIKENSNAYVYSSSSNNKLLTSSSITDNFVWSATADATGMFTITNNGTSKWLQYNPTYSTVGNYTSTQSNAVLPYLYEEYDESAVATPTFSPAAGDYSEAQSVTISCATAGATIYYTTDGSTPTTSSSVYSEAINVSSTTTINAIAVKSGMNNSSMASATYTITLPQVATPTFTPAAGSYTETQSVIIACATDGATIYYTIDGTDPTDPTAAPLTYSEAISVSETTTIKAYATKSGMTDSEVATAAYTISSGSSGVGTGIFERVATTAGLEDGANYLLVYDGGTDSPTSARIYTGIASNNYGIVTSAQTVTNLQIDNSTAGGTVVVLIKNGDNWYIKDSETEKYLAYTSTATSSSNNLWGVSSASSNGTEWTISIASGVATIQNVYNTGRTMRFNTSTNQDRIACYVASNTFPKVELYKEITSSSSVAAPTFSLAEGTYNTAQSVTLTCATDGATIYYTTDGTEPTSSSNEYTGAITVDHTMTIQAIAMVGSESSTPASATYTLKALAPTFSLAEDTYTSVQSVTLACATTGSTIYYTTDGSDPTSSSNEYTGAITVDHTMTIKAIAVKTGWEDSDVASATYTINLPPAVEAPVFSPNGGSFSAPQVVTITSATEGAVIYYTTNGNDLDALGTNGASLTNGQSVTLTSSCTLKAVAVQGSDTSAQTSASFTIGGGSGTTRYERISSTTDLVDGKEYLIVCENDNLIFDGSLTSLDAEGNKYDVTIVTTGTVPYIESTTEIDNRTFTIDTYSTGKSIQAKSGKYIGCTSTKNSLAASDSEILNEISFDGTDAQILSKSRYLRYNNASTNGTRFRYYGTGQQQVQLYKKVTASSAPVTITATVSSVGYSTLFYSDMNLIVPDGVEAYTYTITNGVPVRSKTYSPSGANTIIPAGEAVVLKANAGTYEFTVTTDDAETDDFSDMKGSDVTALTEGGVKYYKMSLNAQQEMGSVGWYFGASGGGAFTNGAHKAYLAVPQAKASQMLSSGFPFSGETTAIDGFVIGDSVLQNAAVFDMQGRRMPTNTQLPKGIYIINGKKFVVK